MSGRLVPRPLVGAVIVGAVVAVVFVPVLAVLTWATSMHEGAARMLAGLAAAAAAVGYLRSLRTGAGWRCPFAGGRWRR
ncbi:hypothetical protein [Actinomadura rudentiformis]|uniref:Uncharacterized protein n=1 Tax=Actinomadura rudentiformis TaxID=359158 RepID=A0A6H9YQF7_9ACTN|nr:hypothetical protein [Actinomadura rudentiformis]KAB2341516.1 hypothetical protein F8566_40950 [Actinomadura rudentiformis]